jgi:SAM-dependent methyltransferase
MMAIMARVLVLVLAWRLGARWCGTSERARNSLRSTSEKDDERECQDPSKHFLGVYGAKCCGTHLKRSLQLGPSQTKPSEHAMGFYQERILPYLVHWSMRQDTFSAYRRRVIPAAQGRVLEVGVGSGLNIPLYGDAATGVIGLDPARKLLLIGKARFKRLDRLGSS